jgi:serine/threonine-protein kinase
MPPRSALKSADVERLGLAHQRLMPPWRACRAPVGFIEVRVRDAGAGVLLTVPSGPPMDDETNKTPRGVVSRCGVYELVREVNRGGTGSVWEGRHITLGRRVAVKVLHTEAAANPEMVARFEREGQAAARIKHPNVAQMLDVGHDESRLWLVMELLEGEDLDTLLQREAPLPTERAVELMLPVIAAVASAHKAGVVHRDLKPGNIFLALDANGAVTPKVVDFGFSKINVDDGNDDGLTREDTALGTLSYMPMEQLMTARQALPASDQYALAVTLYRCVTGRLPFQGESRYETFKAMSAGVFPSPQTVNEALPEGLDAVILRAMARTPDARFPSMRDFGSALFPFANAATQARWARSFGATAPAPATHTQQPPPRPSTPPPAGNRSSTLPRISTVPGLPRVSTPAPQPARVSTPAQPRPSMPPRVSTAPQPARNPAPARVSTPAQPRPSMPPRVSTAPQPARNPPPADVARQVLPEAPNDLTPRPLPTPAGLDALVIAVMVVAVLAVALALR